MIINMKNKIKESKGVIVFQVINIILMLFLILVTLYPFMYIVFASLSNSIELMKHTGPLLYPLDFNLKSYTAVINNHSIYTGYLNTLIILVGGLALRMFLTCFGAYVLSKKELMLRKPMMILIIITMFISGGMIPTYNLVTGMNLDNTLWALIIPGAIDIFNLIILRTGFESVPQSLIEATRIDGGGDITILLRVIIPLSMSTIAVITLYYAVGIWNSWFDAMLYIRDRDLYPLQLILRDILIQSDTSAMEGGGNLGDVEAISESIKYTVIVVTTIPILVVYPFLQKYFVKGTMLGAVKE